MTLPTANAGHPWWTIAALGEYLLVGGLWWGIAAMELDLERIGAWNGASAEAHDTLTQR